MDPEGAQLIGGIAEQTDGGGQRRLLLVPLPFLMLVVLFVTRVQV